MYQKKLKIFNKIMQESDIFPKHYAASLTLSCTEINSYQINRQIMWVDNQGNSLSFHDLNSLSQVREQILSRYLRMTNLVFISILDSMNSWTKYFDWQQLRHRLESLLFLNSTLKLSIEILPPQNTLTDSISSLLAPFIIAHRFRKFPVYVCRCLQRFFVQNRYPFDFFIRLQRVEFEMLIQRTGRAKMIGLGATESPIFSSVEGGRELISISSESWSWLSKRTPQSSRPSPVVTSGLLWRGILAAQCSRSMGRAGGQGSGWSLKSLRLSLGRQAWLQLYSENSSLQFINILNNADHPIDLSPHPTTQLRRIQPLPIPYLSMAELQILFRTKLTNSFLVFNYNLIEQLYQKFEWKGNTSCFKSWGVCAAGSNLSHLFIHIIFAKQPAMVVYHGQIDPHPPIICQGDVYIIIAVMDLKREPYLRKFKKDNEAAVAKKIRELQLAAEQQRHQMRPLLVEEPTQLPQPEPLPPPTASARTVKLDTNETTQTARKKHKFEDYLPTEIQLDLPEVNDGSGQNKPPLPMIVIPGKEEDKELEYFKSDEYKKYLEKLTQAHSKEEKVKAIKENRNNNVYLGKAGTDRKLYIQQIIRTKEVLPRVNLQFLREEAETNARKQIPQKRGQLVNSYMYSEREIQRQARSNKRTQEPTRRQIEHESPIKCIQQEFQMPILREKPSNNATIVLSPVCQKHQKAQQAQKQVKQITLFYHNKQSKVPEIPKEVYNHYQPKPPKSKTHKCETFRKEFQYCEKISNQTERSSKGEQKYEKKSNKSKKSIQNKQNYKKKARLSPSLSSSSSSQRKRHQQNIYEISFKIDKPSFSKREYLAEPRQDIRPVLKRHSPNYNLRLTPEKPGIVKHYQPAKQRIFTEHSYHPYNLESSQTTSAITRQQNQSQSRSPHKISLISRSKHRRLP